MKIRVILGDDHRIMIEGLCALLAEETDIEVIGTASDGGELLRLTQELKPDVLITDLSMPVLNGLEVITRLRAENNPCRIICLTLHNDTPRVLAVLHAGASGYVLKQNSFEELVRAIHRVMFNQLFISGELLNMVVQTTRCAMPISAAEKFRLPQLTPREREVAQLFSEGETTKTIAHRLNLSAKTIATHREHIFFKLDIRSIAELTRYMLREGLTPQN